MYKLSLKNLKFEKNIQGNVTTPLALSTGKELTLYNERKSFMHTKIFN